MRLTRQENEMLEGKYGYPVQKSMEILVGLGECYDAERMIPVASSHILASLNQGKAGALFVEELVNKGAKFVTFTDANPLSIEIYQWKEMGFSEETVREQTSITENYARMGLFLNNTCAPYLVGHIPRLGEHIAWSESSAVIFANSVLGARTNREGISSLASALTGRTPEYGFHLDRNRYGDLEISVTATLKDRHDYGALGYFAGKVSEDKIPVFTGVSPSVSQDELKLLGAGAAAAGSVALYHIVGVTPEAPTRQKAFGPKKGKSVPTVQFGDKELRETKESLNRATARETDVVIFGCPHASISDIREIAQLLSGKKVKPSVELWVLTFGAMKSYAERMGYVDIIKAAGGRVLAGTCPMAMPPGFLNQRGHHTAATNSAKMTFYLAGVHNVLAHYGSTEECVEAATTGAWR